MDLSMFVNDDMGELVDIAGSDPVAGDWRHKAFIPAPLGDDEPVLSGSTYRMVAAAGRALAALDATAQQLPNPYLLRMPSLRREAQSTSALEGTYAPLREMPTADDDAPDTAEMVDPQLRPHGQQRLLLGAGRPSHHPRLHRGPSGRAHEGYAA